MNEINKEFKTIKRAIPKRKKVNICEDFSLRILELKNLKIHYKKELIELKDRIIEFEGLKKLLKQ